MITAVPEIRVGHWSDDHALTGCTVILPPPGTAAAAFVAGGAPGTREMDALSPGSLVQEVHGILLTGGSAFGLAAADGVMRWLEERGVGVAAPGARVPVVPAAVIYDLGIGDPSVRPGPAEGYAACEAAEAEESREGNVGAGMGATVGKTAGLEHQSRGGIGGSSRAEGDLVVGVIAVVNALGDVIDESGEVLAGARAKAAFSLPRSTSTTLVCVATNGTLSRDELSRVARMAATGLARAIRPVHTLFDGDTVFALSTRRVPAHTEMVGRMAADLVAEAVRRGVRAATGVAGAPALGRMHGGSA
ncbi:MAG: P1 family peptidase [Actinomycetota bacterium]